MSYTLRGYRVDLKSLERVFGSKDQALLREIVSARTQATDAPNTLAAERAISELEESLARILDGGPYDEGNAHRYWHAVEILAAHLGQELSMPALANVNSLFLDEVDQVLTKTLHVQESLRLAALLERPPCFALPTTDSFPSIGYLTLRECTDLANVLDGIDPDELDGEEAILLGVAEYAIMIDAACAASLDVLIFYD